MALLPSHRKRLARNGPHGRRVSPAPPREERLPREARPPREGLVLRRVKRASRLKRRSVFANPVQSALRARTGLPFRRRVLLLLDQTIAARRTAGRAVKITMMRPWWVWAITCRPSS